MRGYRPMLSLEIEREVPVAPEIAFALVSVPSLMNRWSEARIEPARPGDGGHPGGTGALRRVHLPFGPERARVLEEVVERAEPPSRFVYRVVRGGGMRSHLGEISIEPSARGARVTWKVRAELGARPLEWLAERALGPSLARSLDAMARISPSELDPRALVLPPVRLLGEAEAAREARPAAEACLAAQRTRADALLGRGDDRGWFARVYQHVTEGQLAACDAGRFEHPGWVLRLVTAFHALWEDNLATRLGERDGEVEPHWQRAHARAERASRAGASTFLRAMRSIHAGMRAHIEDDLPRAIARVHLERYAGRADLARFRADYLRMGDIFGGAAGRITAILPRREWTLSARTLDALTPASMRDRLVQRRFYPIDARRREAFERAEAWVSVRAG